MGANRLPASFGITFEQVEKEMRGNTFGVFCSPSHKGRPHSNGVPYAVSKPDQLSALYVTTNTYNRKVRNIARNSDVAFTIPAQRRLLRFLPPHCIQFQGTASIVPIDDEVAVEAFNTSMLLRRVLELERRHFGAKAVLIRIRPDPVIHTYGLGVPLAALLKHIGKRSSSVRIPSSHFEARRKGETNSDDEPPREVLNEKS